MSYAMQTVEIINKKGLHARASSKFARLASTFSSQIVVRHEGEKAIGIHIMDLLMLAAHKGCQIDISATGEDAGAAVSALSTLVSEGFGELASE